MKKFSEADLTKIREAAAAAEKKTSGEIASAVINESSDYAYYELLFSVLAGAFFFILLLFFHGGIVSWLDGVFWGGAGWQAAGFYGLVSLLVGGLVYLAANIPGFDRVIVPGTVIDKKVHRRALVHFMESGVYDTRDRTGILIFISLKERRVELIADAGINAKVQPGEWDGIVEGLILSLKEDRAAEGVVEAVTACGRILSASFPIKPDDTNELPDGLVFLED